jgi:alpha-beta hydrolase superfamily lysophospholipase
MAHGIFTDRFTDEQGVAITYHGRLVAHPKAVVQLTHGLGEYALRYEPLMSALADAGYSTYAADQRGHGDTGLEQWGGDRTRLGRLGPGGLRATVDDIRQLTVVAQRQHPDVPVVLHGQSWGSLMVQRLMNSPALRHYSGVVMTGTAYRMPGSMDAGDLSRRHRPAGKGSGSGYEWLSRDVAVQERAAADPLMFAPEVLKLFGVADGLRLFGRPARRLAADVPVLIMVGDDDILGGARSARRLAEAYRTRSGLTDVELEVYPGARHELVNETHRDEVVARLVAWLDARFTPAS